jgi:hypothetical protein
MSIKLYIVADLLAQHPDKISILLKLMILVESQRKERSIEQDMLLQRIAPIKNTGKMTVKRYIQI